MSDPDHTIDVGNGGLSVGLVKAFEDSDEKEKTIRFTNHDLDRFQRTVIPFCVGFAGSFGYGITNMSYVHRTLTFRKTVE